MTLRTVFVFAAAVLFAAAAAASVRQSLGPPHGVSDHGTRASTHKPYFLKGKMLDGCSDHSPECVLMAW